MNKIKNEITRPFTRMAALASVCCMAAGSLLPAQAQTEMDTPIAARFQADVTNPSTLLQTEMERTSQAQNERDALPLAEDFSQDSSFALLHADKPSGLAVDLRAGYGQIFKPQEIVFHSSKDEVEEPGWLYLKVRFTF